MDYRAVTSDREFLLSPAHGADLLDEVQSFAADHDVEAAWFSGMGAVQDADLRYYDQDDFEYHTVSFEEPLGIAALVGNVASQDETLVVHAHAVLARPSGQAIAGHLDRATVFSGEYYLRTFEEPLERESDPTTDLDAWAL